MGKKNANEEVKKSQEGGKKAPKRLFIALL